MSLSTEMRSFLSIMCRVYGHPPSANTLTWCPKPYESHSYSSKQKKEKKEKKEKKRYLWTDAFGVCNFITLFKECGDNPMYLDMADALITDVHETLGRHRHGAHSRLGRASDDSPLLGGLRIGKEAEEDEEDGDGQYFHYLTKWMFALNRMSIARNNERYNDLAIELAKSVHKHFVYDTHKARPRMYWKMSIDLSRPLVWSEGNLDPFDGYMTYRVLAHRCTRSSDILNMEIAQMQRMVLSKYKHYTSNDPLDLGEALWICHWFVDDRGREVLGREEWALHVTSVSLKAIEQLYASGLFTKYPSSYRLAFREFGTTIGLQVNPLANASLWTPRVKEINARWSDDIFERDADITPVMYCTSLNPGSFKRGYL